MPAANLLVYDNYNALAVGFSPSEKTSQIVFSITSYPRWVSLFFAQGKGLRDPEKRLKGSGSRIRHIVLEDVKTLEAPAVIELMEQALKKAGTTLRDGKRGALIIKSISARQRPRRTRLRPMRYNAVLFDFDGTLTPSLPLWVKAYHIALRHFGVELTDAELIRRCFFRDWGEVARELHLSSADELQRRVHAGLRIAFLEAQLFPLVSSLLTHCREHGLQTALVTSSPREIVMEVLPRLALDAHFDFVICGDDVANYKPHPEPLLTTLAALNREPREAIMVGDSRVDILAGKAAGTATALFLPDDGGGFHSVDALRATDPDHIFSDHGELPALLGIPELGRIKS